jgi:hypothetical protein
MAWSGSGVRERSVAGDDVLVAGDDVLLGIGDGVTGRLFKSISALEKIDPASCCVDSRQHPSTPSSLMAATVVGFLWLRSAASL